MSLKGVRSVALAISGILFIAGGVTAAPHPIAPTANHATHDIQKRGFWCHSTSVTPRNIEPALISDCWQMYNNIQSGGPWLVEPTTFRYVVQHKTCNFVAHNGNADFAWIGNYDIRDIVKRAIDASTSGLIKVAATGQTWCQSSVTNHSRSLGWTICNNCSDEDERGHMPRDAINDPEKENSLSKRDGQCHDARVTLRTDRTSEISDCWRMYDNIAGSGSWAVPPMTFRYVVQYRSCNFIARNGNADFIYIVNEDIRETVKKAIRASTDGEDVGATGQMCCNSSLVRQSRSIEWVICASCTPEDENGRWLLQDATKNPETSHGLQKRDFECHSTSVDNRWIEQAWKYDCQVMLANIAGDGRWTVEPGTYRYVVQYKTCNFLAKNYAADFVYIGNDDIRDIVTRAIEGSGAPDAVGATGQTWCTSSLVRQTRSLEWVICHDCTSDDEGGLYAGSKSPEIDHALRKRKDYCHDTIINHRKTDMAPVSDCWVMYNNIVGAGKWNLNPLEFRYVAHYGKCHFIVDNQSSGWVYIGNYDIRDIIRKSIEGSEFKDLVSTTGSMWCSSDIVPRNRCLNWQLAGDHIAPHRPTKHDVTELEAGHDLRKRDDRYHETIVSRADTGKSETGHDLMRQDRHCVGGSITHEKIHFAKIEDCWRLYDKIAGSGTWTIQPGEPRMSVNYGDCHMTIHNGNSDFVFIGNDDLRDIVKDSIESSEFKDSDKVAATGHTWCSSSLVSQRRSLEWGLLGSMAPNETESRDVSADHALSKRDKHCGPSSITQFTDFLLAPISDCWQLYNNIQGAGTWTVGPGMNRVLQAGHCHLQLNDNNAMDFVYVGNDDIRAFVKDSINGAPNKTHVKASGQLWCTSSLVKHDRSLEWLLSWYPYAESMNQTLSKRDKHCSDSSITQHTEKYMAPVADCWKMYKNIEGSDTWIILPSEGKILYTGNCHFAIYNSNWINQIYLGNDDIRAILKGSIDGAPNKDFVDTSGQLWCSSSLVGAGQILEWELFLGPYTELFGSYTVQLNQTGISGSAVCRDDDANGQGVDTGNPNKTDSVLNKLNNECGQASFTHHANLLAPTEECQQLSDNISGAGQWTLKPHSKRTVAWYKTCNFTVTNHSNDFVYIGNDDVRDIIRDSIAGSPDPKWLSVTGQVPCRSSLIWNDPTLNWSLQVNVPGPPERLSQSSETNTVLYKRDSKCDQVSYTYQHDALAPATECQQLSDVIKAGQPGVWSSAPHSKQTIACHKTCCFTFTNSAVEFVYLSNDKLGEIVANSIAGSPDPNWVSAIGQVTCESSLAGTNRTLGWSVQLDLDGSDRARRPSKTKTVLQKRNDSCGDSTFMVGLEVPLKNPAMGALVADCQQMALNIQGSGTWTINPHDTRNVVEYHNCRFQVTSSSGSWLYIGNDDIRDLVSDSIAKFSFDGGKYVTAAGSMKCKTSTAWDEGEIHWRIEANLNWSLKANHSPSTGAEGRSRHRCDHATFTNGTDPWKLAPIDDCWAMYNEIVDSVTWLIASGQGYYIAQYGSCGFYGANWNSPDIVYIRNDDIRDLIADSIRMFRGGRNHNMVNANGVMDCGSSLVWQKREVHWSVEFYPGHG